MPMRGRKRADDVAADEAGKAEDRPPRRQHARKRAAKSTPPAKSSKAIQGKKQAGKPAKAKAANHPKAAKHPSSGKGPEPAPRSGAKSGGPRLVIKGGVVYLAGYTVPVWRLAMASRAGSTRAALKDAFPGLPPGGLDLALAYARRHRAEIDRLIRKYGPAEVPDNAEPDGDEGFDRELAELLDRAARLYRRLAR